MSNALFIKGLDAFSMKMIVTKSGGKPLPSVTISIRFNKGTNRKLWKEVSLTSKRTSWRTKTQTIRARPHKKSMIILDALPWRLAKESPPAILKTST